MNRTLLLIAIFAVAGRAIAAVEPADAEWQAIKSFGRPAPQPPNAAQPTATVKAAKFIEEANRLRAFYIAYPSHPSATDAKRLETMALCHAALNGNVTSDARRIEILEQIRRNPSLSPEHRYEAVAWTYQVDVARQNPRDRLAFLGAQESVTRRLIAEFSSVRVGYESLAALARETPPPRGAAIARELRGLTTAPPELKSEAARIEERFGLVDARLASILAVAAPEANLRLTPTKPLVLYTWSAAAPQILTKLRRLATQAPHAQYIGVCLDSNVNIARQLASSANPPGDQYYNSRGASSALAQALKTGSALVIYLVDGNGVIRDVQGGEDFLRKINQLKP
jgi:hypothetical protein